MRLRSKRRSPFISRSLNRVVRESRFFSRAKDTKWLVVSLRIFAALSLKMSSDPSLVSFLLRFLSCWSHVAVILAGSEISTFSGCADRPLLAIFRARS